MSAVLQLVDITQQYGEGETSWLVTPRRPDLTRRTAIA